MHRLIHGFLPVFLLPLALACGDLGVVQPDTGDPDPDPMDDPNPDPDPTSPRATAGLYALYLFDDGAGTTVSDRSGVGLPLDLTIADPLAVTWIPGGGLDIETPTTLLSTGPATKIGNACQAANALTIEAWVATAAVNQAGPARVVSFAGGNNARNFSLAQDEALADIRLRTTDTDDNGTPATLSATPAFDGQMRHLVYNWSGIDDEAQFWIDGQLNSTETVAGNLSTWDMSYEFAVGNEVNGERPWRGNVYLVAIYCRDLSPAEIFQNYQAGI